MKGKVCIALAVAAAIAASIVVTHKVFADNGRRRPVETKLVLVRGQESHLLRGDPLSKGRIGPSDHLYGNDVLPEVLARGWRIRSVHVNQVNGEKDPVGYVLLEK